MQRTKRRLAIPAVLIGITLIIAACSSDKKTTTTGASGSSASGPSLSGVGGEILISGSSTVAPISTEAADQFNAAGATTKITVNGPGTGDGFKAFCQGAIDISDASRPIKAEEADACKAAGIEFIEVKVAFDGLTVMTGSDNDEVTCLSFADLYAITGPEAQGTTNWKQVQSIATELGSTTTFPDAELHITAPGEESGTYDAFVELALQKAADKRVEAGKLTLAKDAKGAKQYTTRADYSSQPNDDAIIEAMKGTEFGWVGFAFADQAGSNIKELEISKDPGGKCIAPTKDTIADGSYPLSRSLYIYVNKAKAASNSAIAPFVDFYLANANEIVAAADYIPLPDDQLSASTSRWTARTVGAAT